MSQHAAFDQVFSVFACEDFEDGTSFLKADYSVSCQASNRGLWLLYAAIVVLLYPLGIPLTYIAIMFTQRHRINPSTVALAGGSVLRRGDRDFANEVLLARAEDSSIAWSQFLWAAYEPHAFYFEAVEMLRKSACVVWRCACVRRQRCTRSLTLTSAVLSSASSDANRRHRVL